MDSLSEGVAIIGLACRLPGEVNDLDALWDFCSKAKCATSTLPKDRFDASHHFHPARPKEGHSYAKAGSFLQDVATFDAPLFNIAEAEAKSMDPQQRLMLETTYLALENAGINIASLSGRADVGVFAAGAQIEYQERFKIDPHRSPVYAATSSAVTMFANRISYFLNLKGPSITVDTACSSALTALHLAVESIKRGECTTAIVSGSCLQLSPHMITYFSNLGTLSEDGKSYSFDHRASGYGRGEGSVCIVLRSAEEAAESNDAIRALIRGSGVNHVGRSQGITLPDGQTQVDLIARVYRHASLDPGATEYVEAHGTGTGRGDPIEAMSISQGLKTELRDPEKPLYIGAVKSNFGHLEFASGLVSIIKCVAMLERRAILPSANFEEPNPSIDLDRLRLKVPTQVLPWASRPRRTSINNFGFGGSNAHIILEEAPQLSLIRGRNPTLKSSEDQLFMFSAKDEASLRSYISTFTSWLPNESLDGRFIANLSYTLCCRRSVFSHRYATHASTIDDLRQKLQGLSSPGRLSTAHRVSFVFTGQGAHWPQMGLDLLKFPVFHETFVRIEKSLKRLGAPWTLAVEIAKPAETSRFGEASVSQPAVTALQICLVELLRSWNIYPSAVCGHSSGEIAAAYAAGFVDLHTCVALAYFRGEASSQPELSHRSGAMMAVGAGADLIEPHIASLRSGLVIIACHNSPESVTVSGDRPAILELASKLDSLSVFHRILKVDVAYHSDHMIPVAGYYHHQIEGFLARATAQARPCTYYSSVNGRPESSGVVTSPWYWVSNLVCPVEFYKATKAMLSGAADNSRLSILEIGPHGALKGPIRDILRTQLSHDTTPSSLNYFPTMDRVRVSKTVILDMVCSLLNSGFDINTKAAFESLNPVVESSTPFRLLTHLPQYHFNTSRQYWHKTRLTEEADHHGSPWHMLLGHKITGTVGDTLEFRNVFTLDDLPWLRDHRVNSDIMFPAAGYFSMAIEALIFSNARRGKHHGQYIDGYCIREAKIGKALVLVETVKNELFTILRPQHLGTRSTHSSVWFHFQILSWTSNAGFEEHCSGLITTKARDGDLDEVTSRSIQLTKKKHIKGIQSQINRSIHFHIAPQRLYTKLAQVGLSYGPAFARISSLRTGDLGAIGSVTAGDTTTQMPSNFSTSLKVHPTTLDAILHAGLCNLGGNNGDHKMIRTNVPIFVESLFISDAFCEALGTVTNILVHNASAEKMSRTSTCSLACFQSDPDDISLEIRGLKTFDIQDEDSISSGAELINPLVVEWHDDSDFIGSSYLDDWPDSNSEYLSPQIEAEKLNQQAYYLIKRALEVVEFEPQNEGHLTLLWGWMRSTVLSIESAENTSPSRRWRDLNDSQISSFIESLTSRSFQAQLNAKVGRQLPAILAQKVDVMNVLFQEDGLWRLYEESIFFSRSNRQLAQLVDRLAHKNPALRILEVGAGTGALATQLLSTLCSEPNAPRRRYDVYDYTDISAGFFNNAKIKLERYPSVNYKTLDICKNPLSQGFAHADYDLIVAMDVIHATSNISESLRNMRKMLKPDGVLAMVELDQFSLHLFPFATLAGWWQKETGPVIKEDEWNKLLLEAGFAGAEVVINDFSNVGIQKLYWTRAVETRDTTLLTVNVIQAGSANDDAKSLSGQLCSLIGQELGQRISPLPLLEFQREVGISILLDIYGDLLLDSMNEANFETLKSICYYSKALLWVTRSSDPKVHFVTGFAKALCLEMPELKVAVLHLNATDYTHSASNILKLGKNLNQQAGAHISQHMELEYRETTSGRIQIPRLVAAHQLQQSIRRNVRDVPVTEQSLFQHGNSKSISIGTVGLLNTLHFEDNLVKASPLGDDEVLIKIEATGLNFKDVMIALGTLPWQGLGREASGVVVAVGHSARAEFPVGCRVLHWGDGLLATHARGTRHNTINIPNELSFEEAASIPVVFTTAYESLVNLARLQHHERILIHAAAGGVGQAAIMISQWIGAEIFCTVGSVEKKNLIMSRYGIAEDHIFSSRNSTFDDGIMAMTNSTGVDVVLNSLAGELLRVSWQSIARFGRLIDISKRDSVSNSPLEMAPFDKSASYIALDLSFYSDEGPRGRKNLTENVLSLVEQKLLRPVHPINTFSISELESAMRQLQAGKHSGKIVIQNRSDAVVKVRNTSPSTTKIHHEATYLITGGSGGLGQYLCHWLLDNGASHIVLASRNLSSMLNSKDVQQMMKVASKKGGRVLPVSCDVGCRSDVDQAVSAVIGNGMPTIRGVIHGAMVLQDSMFETAKLGDWQQVIKPKLDGAVNLHDALSQEPLDFFICLSSLVGTVGNSGQSSYAGSNSFLDGFCAWRNARGLPAASIALPAVSDVGYVAEATETSRQASLSRSSDLHRFSLTGAEVAELVGAAIEYQYLGSHIASGMPASENATQSAHLSNPLLSHLRSSIAHKVQAHANAQDLNEDRSATVGTDPKIDRDALSKASSIESASRILFQGMAQKIGKDMTISSQDISLDSSLSQLGLDSLVAVEFRNWLAKEADAKVRVMEIINSKSLRDLVELVVQQSTALSRFHEGKS